MSQYAVHVCVCIATVHKHTHEHGAYADPPCVHYEHRDTADVICVKHTHTHSHSLHFQFPSSMLMEDLTDCKVFLIELLL